MAQFMTASEQIEEGHRRHGEPTYAELVAINADLVAALEKMLDAPGLSMLDQYGDVERNARAAIAKATIAKD